MRTTITLPKSCNRKRCMQSKKSHRQIWSYKLWKAYVMIGTTTFSMNVLKNQFAKLRLSQNWPYRKNGTCQITISFSLLRPTDLNNLILENLNMHISRVLVVLLIPLSNWFIKAIYSGIANTIANLIHQDNLL